MSTPDASGMPDHQSGLSVGDLSLVAVHGQGPVVRALAIVQLAKRHDRDDELRALLADTQVTPDGDHAEANGE